MVRKQTNGDRGSRTNRLTDYPSLLADIKQRIRTAQVRAAFSANAELIRLYWDIGRAIEVRQQQEGWGASVIPRLARDLHDEIPDVKGFSERNLKRMIAFYRAYREYDLQVPQPVALSALLPGPASSDAIVPQPVAQLGVDDLMVVPPATAITYIPWGHHILLIERIKDFSVRLWYMRQTLSQGWSRNVLALMIVNRAHLRQGKAVTNFDQQLAPPQSDLVAQTLKDPYLFDFLTLEEPFRERELETGLLVHVEKFLLELGQGFAFVGRQYHLDIGGDDFYLDLLFYHLRLRRFVVVDLKKGPFKAEYAGKMNFYCNVVDDRLRHSTDQPTVGLILCQDKSRLVAEYALKGIGKAIGVSEYRLTRAVPARLKSSLPSIEEIEAELSKAKPLRRSRKRKEKNAG